LADAPIGTAASLIANGYQTDTVNPTTIKLDPGTRDELQRLKGSHTYDEVIRLFLRLIPEGDEEGRFSPEFRFQLLEAQLDMQAGRTHSHADILREFGLPG
jgi:hypothetical protein